MGIPVWRKRILSRILSSSSFFAPLKTSLALQRGVGSPTFTRATTAMVFDGAYNILRTANIGEARFQNARRVENLLRFSQDFSQVWQSYVGTLANVAGVSPVSGTNIGRFTLSGLAGGFYQNVAGASFVGGRQLKLVWLKAGTASSVQFKCQAPTEVYRAGFNLLTGVATTVSGTGSCGVANAGDGWLLCWASFASVSAGVGTCEVIVLGASGQTVYIGGAQLENVTGQSYQGPSEYISTGVLSFPFHGCGVAGVKYFSTYIDGTPLPDNDTQQIGYLAESAATNLYLNSAVLATQTIATTEQQYTLSFYGTGSVVITGGATGTLSGTGANNRVSLTVTSSGIPIVLTLTGSGTNGQFEAGTVATSPIPTTSVPVTRNADQFSYQTSGNIGASFTLLATATPLLPESYSNTQPFVSVDDGMTANRAQMYRQNGSPIIFTSNGAGNSSINGGVWAKDLRVKMCAVFADGRQAFSFNGEAVINVPVPIMLPTSIPLIHIGMRGDGGTYFNGIISDVRIFNRALLDEQLKLVTKP